MDIFTHALLGGTLAYAAAPYGAPLGVRERVLLGGTAAVFPDLDFIAFPFNPLQFLSDWHQGPTHSLLLLPLWSLLIAGAFVWVGRRRGVFAAAFLISVLGLASHIASDVITNERSILTEVFVEDGDILVLGAGGAARAVVYALNSLDMRVTLVNRSAERAQRVASDLEATVGDLDVPYDLLVNTTPVGMSPEVDASPI